MVEDLVNDASLPLLLVLVGPTGSGKTTLSLQLAERLHGEIVSCDSVAVYRELEIGTAKPSREERMRVPHHLIDVVAPDEPYTAGDYCRDAREAVRGIANRGCVPIVVGGTGLYLRAFLQGLFPGPPRSEELRERLQRRESASPGWLHRVLKRLDAAAAERIHANDVPKLVRALEVRMTTRKTLDEAWEAGREALTGFHIVQVGLAPERERLYQRINRRAAEMFGRGLVEETERLVGRYGYECRPLQSLGYAQACAVLRGEMTRDGAVASAQQGHRNYAKRQGTWFRREAGVHRLAGCGDDEGMADAVMKILAV